MKQPRRIQKVPARPVANKQRTGQRPAPRKADPVGKAHAGGRRPAAVPVGPILQAQRDAAAAETEVAKISRAHLATLMASPPRVRMAHFNDPELTPADRTELEQSVRSALPRSAPVKAALSKLANYPRRLLRACGYKMCRRHCRAGGRRPARRLGMAQHGRADGGFKRHLDNRLAPARWFDLARRMEGRPACDRDVPAQRKGSPSILVERSWLCDDRGRPGLAAQKQFRLRRRTDGRDRSREPHKPLIIITRFMQPHRTLCIAIAIRKQYQLT